MKKIFQLPFLIPEWIYSDISTFINTSINKQLEDSPYAKEFETHKDIIAKGIA